MAKEKMDIEKKKCKTFEFRSSFPHVFEAHTGFEGQEPKFSIVMLFDNKTDLGKAPVGKDGKPASVSMKQAVFNAATEKWGPKEKWPKNLRLPFRDGNEKEDLNGYANTIFVTATSKQRPGVINQKMKPIVKEDESFYAGCYARATLIAFAYDKAGNRGVSFSLQNLQKTRDGEQFSGRRAAEDEFEEIDDGSEKEENYDSGGGQEVDLGF